MTAIDSLFELTDELMCVTRADSTIDLASLSFGRAVGKPSAELIGASLGELVHPDDGGDVRDRLRTLSPGETTCFEARLLCAEGVHRPFVWRAMVSGLSVCVVAREGGPAAAREPGEGVVSDAADGTRLAILSRVGHELRTPLTCVRGSLGLLEGGVAGQLDEGAARLVAIACRNTERLIRLVDLIDEALNEESGAAADPVERAGPTAQD